MRLLILVVSLAVAVVGSGYARDFAAPVSATAALQYLKQAKAVAICETGGYFDGGSLSFTFAADDGQKMVFVLSCENQRNEIRKFLSIDHDRHIQLIPDSSYEESTVLLRQKLAAGLADGLQQKWPAFKDDAEALCVLLKEGGHAQDLDDFYLRSAKRLQEAHEAFLKTQANSRKEKEPNRP